MPDKVAGWQDLRYTARSLVGRPALTAGIILSLSLGIGISATTFSLIAATLFEPIPGLPEADRVLIVGSSTNDREVLNGYLTYLDCKDIISQSKSFLALASFSTLNVNLEAQDRIETIRAAAVGSEYFSVTASTPSQGVLSWSDDQERRPVAVIAYRLWKRLFSHESLEPGVSLVNLNGTTFEIIGVAPKDFQGLDRVDPVEVWVPLEAYSYLASGPLSSLRGKFDRHQEWLQLVGRLQPNRSLESAQRELSVLEGRLGRRDPDASDGKTIVAVTAQESAFGPGGRERLGRYLTILTLIASLALLVSCATVANLLLARGLGRQEEFAIRLCLGGDRAQLLKLLLLEGITLAALGGLGGIILAMVALSVVDRVRLPVESAVSSEMNLGAVAFAFAAAILVGLVASLLPGLRLVKRDALEAIRGTLNQRRWLRRLAAADFLVVAQMGIAFILLVSAGLFLRTVDKLEAVETGFEAEKLVVFDLDISHLENSPTNAPRVYERILNEVRTLPGVERASLVSGMPIFGGTLDVRLSMTIDGVEPKGEGSGVMYAVVSPGYFKTVGTPIVRGRGFSAQDADGSPPVVILDQTVVDQYQISGEPVGASVRLAQGEGPFEVIGVAGGTTPADTRETGTPVLYLPYTQWRTSFVGNLMVASMSVVVRAGSEPSTVISGIRRAVQRADQRLPPLEIVTFEERLAESREIERQAGGLFSVLGGVSYVLALVGLYGLMTQAVVRRRSELAIRMAVGAKPGAVLKLVLGQGFRLSLAALALGVPAAWAFARVARSYLYEVSASDPATFAIVGVSQTAFVLLVALLPSWRATRIDLCDGLRSSSA